MTEKKLLCIDCILSDMHKTHEILSLEKASNRELSHLNDKISEARSKELQLRVLVGGIESHMEKERSQAARNIQELKERIIEIETLLEREEAEARTKSDALQTKIDAINNFVESSTESADSLCADTLITFLSSCVNRTDSCALVLSDDGLPTLPLVTLFYPLPSLEDSVSSKAMNSTSGGPNKAQGCIQKVPRHKASSKGPSFGCAASKPQKDSLNSGSTRINSRNTSKNIAHNATTIFSPNKPINPNVPN